MPLYAVVLDTGLREVSKLLTVESGDKHTFLSHMSAVRSGMAEWLYDINLFLCIASLWSQFGFSHGFGCLGYKDILHGDRSFLRVNIPKDSDGGCHVFYDLISGIFQYHICFILLTVICTDKGRAGMNSIFQWGVDLTYRKRRTWLLPS